MDAFSFHKQGAMKYFTRELWTLINSENTKDKEFACAQWKQNDISYETYIGSLKNARVRRALKTMNQYDGFHDYDVDSITYNVERKTCDIFLHCCDRKYQLHFFGLSAIQADMGFLNFDFPKLRWGYYEIELLSNGKWLFSVAFDPENEISLTVDGMHVKAITK